METTVKRKLFGVYTSSLLDFLFRSSNFFFLIWGAFSIVQKRYSYGTLMAVLQLVSQVLAPFSYSTSFIPFLFEMSAAKKRVGELLALPSDQLHPSPLLMQFESICIDHVSFAIQDRIILQTQRHIIHRNEKIAVVGESGAGKTTFFKNADRHSYTAERLHNAYAARTGSIAGIR